MKHHPSPLIGQLTVGVNQGPGRVSWGARPAGSTGSRDPGSAFRECSSTRVYVCRLTDSSSSLPPFLKPRAKLLKYKHVIRRGSSSAECGNTPDLLWMTVTLKCLDEKYKHIIKRQCLVFRHQREMKEDDHADNKQHLTNTQFILWI